MRLVLVTSCLVLLVVLIQTDHVTSAPVASDGGVKPEVKGALKKIGEILHDNRDGGKNGKGKGKGVGQPRHGKGKKDSSTDEEPSSAAVAPAAPVAAAPLPPAGAAPLPPDAAAPPPPPAGVVEEPPPADASISHDQQPGSF